MMYRLKKDDSLNGQRVPQFNSGTCAVISHDLTPEEESLQLVSRSIWDEKERFEAQGRGARFEKGEVYRVILRARQAIVHRRVLDFPYGELGNRDHVTNEDSADLSFDQLRAFFDTVGVEYSATQSSADNRRSLQEVTKKEWVTSSRMLSRATASLR